MAKTMRVKMTDKDGAVYFWTVRAFRGVSLDIMRKAQKFVGWSFTDHEGCERIIEGNWLELAARFHGVSANYGLTSNLS